ncbi:MAG: DUF4292 domain-containing protein [Aureispira sp.]
MNRLFWGLLCVSLCTFISCKATVVTDSTAQPTKKTAKFLLRQLTQQMLSYEWFGCRAKIKVDSEQQDVVFTAALRMQKDSIIWVRIKKMSVEGARIKITPQSIEILNRQESQYIKRPFSFIKEEYGLDITFAQLQEVLLGNPILYKKRPLLSGVEGKRLVLKTPPNQKEVLKLFLRANDFLLDEWRGSVEGSSLSINYSAYELLEKQQIATKKVVHIDSEEVGIVDINFSFSGMVLNEIQKVGFTVPSSYEHL